MKNKNRFDVKTMNFAFGANIFRQLTNVLPLRSKHSNRLTSHHWPLISFRLFGVEKSLTCALPTENKRERHQK